MPDDRFTWRRVNRSVEKGRRVGMQELCGSYCLKIPRFAPEVRVEALPFQRLVQQFVVSPRRSAFFGSFEVGNQLDCLSTPEKSPCTLPSVHSFSHSHSLSLSLSLSCPLLLPYFLYCTLTDGHATTLFFVYSLYARALVSSRSDLARFRRGASILPPFFSLPLSPTFFRPPPFPIPAPCPFSHA